MLTLRGMALGAGMYVVLILIYAFVSVKAAHLMPGQQVGFDVRSLSATAIRNPMFWITFVVLGAIGSSLLNSWKR